MADEIIYDVTSEPVVTPEPTPEPIPEPTPAPIATPAVDPPADPPAVDPPADPPVVDPPAEQPAYDPITPPSPEAPPAVNLLEPPPIVINSELSYRDYLSNNIVELHKAISNVAPIVGVTGMGDNMSVYRIDFAAGASTDQIAAANAVLLSWPKLRENARKVAYAYEQLDAWFASQIAAGCAVSAGFTLGLSDSDITLLTGNYILAQAAVSAGMQMPAIIDISGVSHQLGDITAFTTVMLEYGQYRSQLSSIYAAKRAEIATAAATLELPQNTP